MFFSSQRSLAAKSNPLFKGESCKDAQLPHKVRRISFIGLHFDQWGCVN